MKRLPIAVRENSDPAPALAGVVALVVTRFASEGVDIESWMQGT